MGFSLFLAGPAFAQAQVPAEAALPGALPLSVPVGPPPALGLATEGADGLEAVPPLTGADSVPCDCGRSPAHLRRFCQRTRTALQSKFVGYPAYFAEPALGWSLYQNMGRQKNKADVHTFTLYRSDFMAGTAELSPGGARRLSFLAGRLGAWPGPVVIEWTPDQPGLAEGRRAAVALALQTANLGVDPGRVIVGPSAYRGITGIDAGNNHDALIFRSYTAPRSYSVSPTSTAEFGGGSR